MNPNFDLNINKNLCITAPHTQWHENFVLNFKVLQVPLRIVAKRYASLFFFKQLLSCTKLVQEVPLDSPQHLS
jgi:hypothetical protein